MHTENRCDYSNRAARFSLPFLPRESTPVQFGKNRLIPQPLLVATKMTINIAEIRALPPAEQLRLVELIWDQLGAAETPIPLPEWVEAEGKRRLAELQNNPALGVDHATTWQQIHTRNAQG